MHLHPPGGGGTAQSHADPSFLADHLEQPSYGAQSSQQPPSSPPPPSVLPAMTFANTETAATAPSSPLHPASLAVSASAPQIQSPRALDAASVPFSPSFDSALTQSSRNSSAEALTGFSALEGPASGTASPPDVDPTIIQALQSKDRLWVLKLGEMMEGLINDRRCVFPSWQRSPASARCCVASRLLLSVESFASTARATRLA